MNSLKVLKTLILINTLVQILLPFKGNCKLLSGAFTKGSNAGPVLAELYKTRQVRSCGECAAICMMERVSPWMCGAYSCLPSDTSCDFYAIRTPNAILQINVNVYLFQTTDVFHPILINGRTYSIYLSSTSKSHKDAKTHCQNMDSHLFYFDSLDDYEAIRIILFGSPYASSYVGINDKEKEGTWVSDRDGAVIDNSVLLWGDGEPDNLSNNEGCAVIKPTLKLHDVPCGRIDPFLCKRNG